MRWAVVLLVLAAAVVLIGRMQAFPGARESSAEAEKNVRGVAQALAEATAKADDAQAVLDSLQPSPAEAQWIAAWNRACSARAAAVAGLGAPRTLDDMGRLARRWLAADRVHDRRVARLPAPSGAAAGARRLARLDARQERSVRRVAAAARRGDSEGALAAVGTLRLLAARGNTVVAELGLTECFLPVAGLPYG
jgi:hypothetical protein